MNGVLYFFSKLNTKMAERVEASFLRRPCDHDRVI